MFVSRIVARILIRFVSRILMKIRILYVSRVLIGILILTAAQQRRYSGAVFCLSLISFVVKTKKFLFQKSSLVLVNDFETYRHKETDNIVCYSGATAALF